MNWEAAGIRHAVLLRILPVLSHDLATPIMVLRMTAMVLRRKLEHDPVDAHYFVERLAALDQQTETLSETLKLLGGWGPGAAGDSAAVSRPGLVAGCVALLEPLLRMHRVRLCTDPSLQATRQGVRPHGPAPTEDGQPRWPRASSLRYLLLGSIFYLQDVYPHLERIDIRPDGGDALRLVAFSRRPSRSGPDVHEAGSEPQRAVGADDRMRLDTAALECLAEDVGCSVRFSPDGVWLRLDPG